MEKLTRLLNKVINADSRRFANSSRPEELVKESHKDVIISDSRRWDGASIDQVRDHFAEYLRNMEQEDCSEEPRFAACLSIDEVSLQSIVAADDSSGFVGVVDGRYQPGKKYDWPSYHGYMRAEIRAL
ncbi:uncharacterized protein N7483_007944 [Penicillium malachiteum]|uniref:uncharacterized protein n=1 Tax=Penicillium malachiteum TaxID=1324776 RepID=UPI002547F19B|nr:uncharacterized protein N7483_007944 [Penicillium malachiteum]KAJ5726587.1 hypothetical protein N7483_007944 [Penicillium malachiteum]